MVNIIISESVEYLKQYKNINEAINPNDTFEYWLVDCNNEEIPSWVFTSDVTFAVESLYMKFPRLLTDIVNKYPVNEDGSWKFRYVVVTNDKTKYGMFYYSCGENNICELH